MANSKSDPLIETRDLVKKFGTFTALNGVSLKVYPGEVMRFWVIMVQANQR